MNSITNGVHYVPTSKWTHFVVSKDGWYTKEGPSKSLQKVLYVQQYTVAKGTSWAETASIREKIKPISLAIVKLHESEGISQ